VRHIYMFVCVCVCVCVCVWCVYIRCHNLGCRNFRIGISCLMLTLILTRRESDRKSDLNLLKKLRRNFTIRIKKYTNKTRALGLPPR
jgi:hypothetical protein